MVVAVFIIGFEEVGLKQCNYSGISKLNFFVVEFLQLQILVLTLCIADNWNPRMTSSRSLT